MAAGSVEGYVVWQSSPHARSSAPVMAAGAVRRSSLVLMHVYQHLSWLQVL